MAAAAAAPVAPMTVHRTIDHPSGDGTTVRQLGTVLERNGKLVLQVHGMGAIGENAKARSYNSLAALTKAGWEEGR